MSSSPWSISPLNTAAYAVADWHAAERDHDAAVARAMAEASEAEVAEAVPVPAPAVEISPNPLCVRDDETRSYEWRAVAITGDGKQMSEDMRRLTEEQGFEYASTTAGSQNDDHRHENASSAILRGAVHLYRRKRTSALSGEDAVFATLVSRLKILAHKKDIDEVQVAIVSHKNEHSSILG